MADSTVKDILAKEKINKHEPIDNIAEKNSGTQNNDKKDNKNKQNNIELTEKKESDSSLVPKTIIAKKEKEVSEKNSNNSDIKTNNLLPENVKTSTDVQEIEKLSDNKQVAESENVDEPLKGVEPLQDIQKPAEIISNETITDVVQDISQNNTSTDDERFYFWGPFYLKTKADRFAKYITSISGVTCLAGKTGPSEYRVYYLYEDETDKLAKAVLIKSKGIKF